MVEIIKADAADALAALPITLTSWEATPTPTGIDLSWASANETDNDFYLVEHSTDGRNFEELTQVAGETSSEVELTYAFHHAAPAAGTHYYRLSQQDLDGTRTTFDVLTVRYGEVAAGRAYPNPAMPGDVITLGTQAEAASLYHVDGRRIADFQFGEGSTRQITLPATLSAGLYVLRFGEESKMLMVR